MKHVSQYMQHICKPHIKWNMSHHICSMSHHNMQHVSLKMKHASPYVQHVSYTMRINFLSRHSKWQTLPSQTQKLPSRNAAALPALSNSPLDSVTRTRSPQILTRLREWPTHGTISTFTPGRNETFSAKPSKTNSTFSKMVKRKYI